MFKWEIIILAEFGVDGKGSLRPTAEYQVGRPILDDNFSEHLLLCHYYCPMKYILESKSM